MREMKQPLIGLASVLAVTISLASVPYFADADVRAAGNSYGIWVGTTEVTSDNKDDILKGDENNTGLAKYDPETGILSLKDVKITKGMEHAYLGNTKNMRVEGIHSEYDLKIDGSVEISGVEVGIFSNTLYTPNAGTVIEIDAESVGIESPIIDLPGAAVDITLNNADQGVGFASLSQVELKGTKLSVSGGALGISADTIEVYDNANVDVSSTSTAISCNDTASFKDCTVTAKQTGAKRGDQPKYICCIYADEIAFDNTTLNVTSNIVAVFGSEDVDLKNCSANVKGGMYAIASDDRLTISGSKVIAEADTIAIYSSAIVQVDDKIIVPENGKVVASDVDEMVDIGMFVADANGKAATSVKTGDKNFDFLPDVTGKNYEEAEKTLSDFFGKTGLTITIQRGWVNNSNPDKNLLVASMDPASGSVIDEDTKTVTIYVYEGYNPTSATTETTEPEKTEPETAEPEETKTTDKVGAFVERLYNVVLGRDSEADGAAFWTKELKSLKCTGAEVAQGFIFSKEFTDKNLSDKDFVTVLYKAFFDRDPDTDGLNYWVGLLENKTSDRTAVANGFIFSKEWADTCKEYGIKSGANTETDKELTAERVNAFVERMYTTALGRESDKDGAAYWVEQLTSKKITGEQLGLSFFLSEELTKANLSDKEFVDRLYLTFMNREAESEGETYWIGILKEGTSRKDVVLGFTRSAEFTDRCTEADILPF